MRKNLFFVFLIFPFTIFATTSMTTFEFLRLPNGARPTALGGSFVGASDDPYSLFCNPAGLWNIKGKRIGTTFGNYVADIHLGCISYVYPLRHGILGIGTSYISFGKMEERDENNNLIGKFTPLGIVPTIGYGISLPRRWQFRGYEFASVGEIPPSLGISMKIVYQTIGRYTGLGVAFDIGGIYYHRKELAVGAVIQNLGIELKSFYEVKEELPLTLKVGAVYHPQDHINLFVDISKPIETSLSFAGGIEWEVSPAFTVRSGYSTSKSELRADTLPLDLFAPFSFGIGFKRDKFLVDLSITPMVLLGWSSKISLIWNL
ncbi:MAG TPA: PorV/PorQ family protein [bacterium (Candidatus Stahlbacteria)]|nr:PorV/PorQ family protein [Candidatus Stahlbacteria bacterium]